jgi:hypothetical protein
MCKAAITVYKCCWVYFLLNNYDIEYFRYIKKFTKHKCSIEFLNECYLYDDDDLIEVKEIFSDWYKIIKHYKTLFPNNSILKGITSRCWGDICKGLYMFKYEHELFSEGIKAAPIEQFDKSIHTHIIKNIEYNLDDMDYNSYKLVNATKSLQKYNIRLKAHILSYGRYMLGRTLCYVEKHTEVLHINTDGFIIRDTIPVLMKDVKNNILKHKSIERCTINNSNSVIT